MRWLAAHWTFIVRCFIAANAIMSSDWLSHDNNVRGCFLYFLLSIISSRSVSVVDAFGQPGFSTACVV